MNSLRTQKRRYLHYREAERRSGGLQFGLRTLLAVVAAIAATLGAINWWYIPAQDRSAVDALTYARDPIPGSVSWIPSEPWGSPVETNGGKDPSYRVTMWPEPSGALPPNELEYWTRIARVRRLAAISAAGRPVTYSHVGLLAGHRGLMYLNLAGSRLKPNEIHELALSLESLRWLVVSDDMLGPSERAALSKAHPQLTVHAIPKADVPQTNDDARPGLYHSPLPPWLRDQMVTDGECRADVLDAFVQLFIGETVIRPDGIGPYPAPSIARVRSTAAWPDVIACNFNRSNFGDAELAALNGLATILYLDMANTNVTAAGLQALRSIRGIRSLYIDDRVLTDETIGIVEALPHLRCLTVLCQTMPHPMETLMRRELPHVELRFKPDLGPNPGSKWGGGWDGPDWAKQLEPGVNDTTRLTSDAFWWPEAFFVEAKNRQKLPMLMYAPTLRDVRWGPPDEPLRDDTLALLTASPRLESVDLGQVRASSFAPIAQRSHIKSLSATCDLIDTDGVASLFSVLATLPNLRDLFIADAVLSERAIASLAKCGPLRELTLYECKLPASDEAVFKSLQQLQSMAIQSPTSGRREFVRPSGRGKSPPNEQERHKTRCEKTP